MAARAVGGGERLLLGEGEMSDQSPVTYDLCTIGSELSLPGQQARVAPQGVEWGDSFCGASLIELGSGIILDRWQPEYR